ncbi:hypothetical protein Cmtc_47060 [Cupriavidus sp. TKC]|nr:hypothetical protein Cmtc_47060 [Cupriavidus sp. TKC]
MLPQSDSQLVVVIDERFAQTVDADTVCAEAHDGIETLRDTVRDAATCTILETEARNCPGIKAVHSELLARNRSRTSKGQRPARRRMCCSEWSRRSA